MSSTLAEKPCRVTQPLHAKHVFKHRRHPCTTSQASHTDASQTLQTCLDVMYAKSSIIASRRLQQASRWAEGPSSPAASQQFSTQPPNRCQTGSCRPVYLFKSSPPACQQHRAPRLPVLHAASPNADMSLPLIHIRLLQRQLALPR
jgi:hypothetical protein